MAEPAFTPEIEKALNSYAVPPIPQGFSDRLMARIVSGDTGAVEGAGAPPLPARRRTISPWRRSSRIIGSVAIVSLITATAAAAGIFGERLYVPVISEALVEAKIVDAPKPPAVKTPVALAESKPAVPSATANETPKPTGSAAIVGKVTELRNDPEFAGLRPRERLAVARKEVRALIRSGEATPQDVRTAVRELARNADPETKGKWRQAATERREQRLERRALATDESADPVPTVTADPASGEDPVAASDELPATATLTFERAEALRDRYRNATPEQRAALRAALRERRQIRQQRRTQ